MPVLQVSVLLPLFGDHRATKTLPTVCRAWLQQNVPCEVVVALAAGTAVSSLGDLAADGPIRIVPADRDSISPGPLRNLAASTARASVLYLSDADVAPLADNFAEQALKLLKDRAMIQPWMYRLVSPAEMSAVPPFDLAVSGRACHVSVDADGRLVPLSGERFIWMTRDALAALPPPGTGWLKDDGTPWYPVPYHWGGIMVRRETFDAVGGYCTRYVGWGSEDDDLIAKLEGTVGTIRAWKAAPRKLACLHFEHPRSHTFAQGPTNDALLAERLAAGVDAMIEEDRQRVTDGVARADLTWRKQEN